jgi:ATP-binding cassette subfamily C (CFTR/MRP) protein 1
LKRLDAVTKSPIFAVRAKCSHFAHFIQCELLALQWFSESLAGVSTIRAFGQQSTFIANNQLCIDSNQTAYLPSITINRWLALRLELVGSSSSSDLQFEGLCYVFL